jgi:hypothetical protein
MPKMEDSPADGHAEPAHPVIAPTFTPSLTPEQAAARVNTQTEPTATPAFTIPITSELCVTVYGDHNANRRQDDGEPVVVGTRLVLQSDEQTVRELVTMDAGEPVCFGDLAPSDLEGSIYYLTAIAPPGHRTPGSNTWQIRLGEQDVHILIGLRKTHKAMWGLAQAENTPVVTGRDPRSLALWITFLIAGGILSIVGWSVLGQH